MSLAAIFASLPWGGVLGFVSSWLQRRQELKQIQIEHAQNVELMKLQQAAAINAAEWAAFTASQQASAAEDGAGVWKWVKSVRYGTRAGLTWLLVIAAVGIAWRQGSTSELAARILFFAEMSLAWWFGSRTSFPSRSK